MEATPKARDRDLHAVYFPSWKVYKGVTPAQVVDSGVNAVLYAFIIPNEDGTLQSLDDYADTQMPVDGELGCLNALRRLKNEHSELDILLSIGGGSGSAAFPVFAAAEETRMAFARSAREWVDRYGLDGVDIDWEHPKTQQEGRSYALLLEACRAQLPQPRYLVTTALPVDLSVLGVLDVKCLASDLLDHINLMCYDFTGPWTSVAGHHAQLFCSEAEMDTLGWRPSSSAPEIPRSVGHKALSRIKASSSAVLQSKLPHQHRHRRRQDETEQVHPQLQTSGLSGIRYLVERGVPVRKIILGIPLYARIFPGARRVGDGFACGHEGGEELVMDYCDVPRKWRENAQVDRLHVAAWYTHENEESSASFVSMDVPQTLGWKLCFAHWFGLGGVVFWAFGGDRAGDDGSPGEMIGCRLKGHCEDAPWNE